MTARRTRLLRASGCAVAVGVPLAALALVVRAQVPGLQRWDEAVVDDATGLVRGDPALYRTLLVWQEAFQARWVNLVVAGVCVWVWRRHGLRGRAVWGLVTLLVTWNLGLLVKYLVARSRPVVEDALTEAPGYSFPSGHAANTAAAGTILVVVLWPLLGPRARVVVPAAVAAAVVLTGADRVLLGAHYPSDVVAGFLFGAGAVGAAYVGYLGGDAGRTGAPPDAPDAPPGHPPTRTTDPAAR